jgi:hypothetical protein
LEAAGLLVEGCCSETTGQHGGAPAGHDTDGCHLVEGSNYKSSSATIKISQPVFVSCLCLICANASEPMLVQASATPAWEYAARPRDWVPTWRFVQRTALAPRAPSLV